MSIRWLSQLKKCTIFTVNIKITLNFNCITPRNLISLCKKCGKSTSHKHEIYIHIVSYIFVLIKEKEWLSGCFYLLLIYSVRLCVKFYLMTSNLIDCYSENLFWRYYIWDKKYQVSSKEQSPELGIRNVKSLTRKRQDS